MFTNGRSRANLLSLSKQLPDKAESVLSLQFKVHTY